MNAIKRLIALLLLTILFSTSAFAITNAQVFAYAEATYSSIFPGTPAPQAGTYQIYNYQYYPTTGNYLAVDNTGTNIYILGPALTGGVVEKVGTVASYANTITAWETTQSGNGTTSSLCGSSAPAGFNYSQSGNTITVTTTGCIALPTAGICQPSAPQATGISVLETSNIQSSSFSGITINSPYFSLNQLTSQMNNAKICIRNAPANYSNLTINENVCFDMTQQFGSSFSGVPGVTVTPPITMSMNGTTTMSTVANCTTTGASAIYDAYTRQTLLKQANGTYQ